MRSNLLIFVLLSCVLTGVKAEDHSVILGGWSYHFIADDTTNSNHQMIGYQYGNWVGAHFKNSYDDSSFFGGYSVLQYEKSIVKIELLTGIVTGYEYCLGRSISWCPTVVPTLKLDTGFKVKPQFVLLGDALVIAVRIDI